MALPPQKKPKYPTPTKTRNSMGMEVFSCRKNAKIPGAHKIGAAISGPRIAGNKIYGYEACSDSLVIKLLHATIFVFGNTNF